MFEREQRLQAILDTAFCAIVTLDQGGTIESCNQAVHRVFGYSPGDLNGKNIEFLLATDNGKQGPRYLVESLASQNSDCVSERLGRRSDGTTFPMALFLTSLRLGDRQLYTIVVDDLTDEKRALQAERLASIGQMMAAITHESRNALQRIQAGVDMLQFAVSNDREAREDLGRMSKATDDLQRLFEELRTFAAPIALKVDRCDLSKIWQRAWASLEASRNGRKVSVHDDHAGVDLTCTLDSFRLEQVFRILLENSLAACEDPVEIAIQCRDANLDGAPAVCVHVRDNGPGLTDEQKTRIFEAFYTTKPKGTGLGMAIAQRIVSAHQGHIALGDCQRGAEFIMTLPRHLP